MKKLSINIPSVTHTQSGSAGNILWSIFNETLTISGTGPMSNYHLLDNTRPPWYIHRNSITNVIIKEGVNSIGNYGFTGLYGLVSVTIPRSVTTVGCIGFSGCSSLSVIINHAVTPQTITSLTFNNVARNTCTLYVPVASIEVYQAASVWKEFNIKGVIIGKVGKLNWMIFNGTLTITGNGKMPNYEKENSPWTVHHTSFSNLVIEDGVETIGDYAFWGCRGLLSLSIPNSVTKIGYSAFEGCCNLTNIVIPGSVNNIGYKSFADCHSLVSVTIPKSVIFIGYGAFKNCNALTEIINYAGKPQSVKKVFGKMEISKCVLRVPSTSIITYRFARGWRGFRIKEILI